MTDAPKGCIRGCVQRGRHIDGCGVGCVGCNPRPAEHGLLCKSCYYRLSEWLGGDMPEPDWWDRPANRRREIAGSLTWAREAVTIAAGDGLHGIAYDVDRVSSGDTPAPVNLSRLVLLAEIDDTVGSWLGYWVSERGLRGVDHFELAYACRYLSSWIDQLVEWEPIGDFWDELADLVSRAHAIAPWRRERRSCANVPCVECARTALFVYGGDDFVTCVECGYLLSLDEYERWVRIVADDAKPKPLSFWAHERSQTLRALQKQVQRIGLNHDSIGRSGAKLYYRSTMERIT